MTTQEKLHQIIEDSFSKTNADGEIRPGVIALEGPWGCGKSHLLNKTLNEWSSEKPYYNLVVPFNAWEDDVGDKPIVPALFRLAKTLDGFITGEDIKKVCGVKIKTIVGLLCVDVPSVLCPGVAPFLYAGEKIVGRFTKARKDLHEIEKARTLSHNDSFVAVSSWSDLYARLGELCDSPSAEQYRIILLIDDLDRVLPTRQMNLLESLHHLAESARVLVLVAYDPDQLKQSVTTFFGEGVSVNKYTQKIFNQKVTFESADCQVLHQSIARSLSKISKPSFEPDAADIELLLSPFALTARSLAQTSQTFEYLAGKISEKPLLETMRLLFKVAIDVSLIREEDDKKKYRLVNKLREELPPAYDYVVSRYAFKFHLPTFGNILTWIEQYIYGKHLDDPNYYGLTSMCVFSSLDATVSINDPSFEKQTEMTDSTNNEEDTAAKRP